MPGNGGVNGELKPYRLELDNVRFVNYNLITEKVLVWLEACSGNGGPISPDLKEAKFEVAPTLKEIRSNKEGRKRRENRN